MKNIDNNQPAEIVSFFFGLLVVFLVGFSLFSFFRKIKPGIIDLPGLSTEYTTKPVIIKFEKSEKNSKERSVSSNQKISPKEVVTIERGDSLWKIAKKYYGDGNLYIQIAKDNGLRRDARLEIGQRLLLKQPTKLDSKIAVSKIQEISPILGEKYTVVKGDNLAKIALRAYGDSYAWTKIWEANKNTISKPSLIYSGNVLVIPRN